MRYKKMHAHIKIILTPTDTRELMILLRNEDIMSAMRLIPLVAFLGLSAGGHLPTDVLPPRGGPHVPILRYDNLNDGEGTYSYSYETADGISVQESGSPHAQGPEGPAVTAAGSYSYRAPDGQQVSLSYTADESGFHPVGAHLPTPPPIPEEILRSLQLNSQYASSDDGSYSPSNEDGGYHY